MWPGEQNPEAVAGQWEVKDSGKMAEYASGMRRDTTEGKPKFRLMWPKGVPYTDQLIYRVAMHYMRGGLRYGDRNWEKSCTPEDLAHHEDALERHFHKFLEDVQDGEDHAAAIVWNVNAVLLTRRNIRLSTPKQLTEANAPNNVPQGLDAMEELARADAAAVLDDDLDDERVEVAAEQAKDRPIKPSLSDIVKEHPDLGVEGLMGPKKPVACPDGGTCHHECKDKSGACFRVLSCGPLSGVYPGNRWPEKVRQQHHDLEAKGLWQGRPDGP